jgi:lambda family phage portal protein
MRDAQGLTARQQGELVWDNLTRQATSVETQGPLDQPYEAANTRGTWFRRWHGSIQSPDREWLGVRDFSIARVRGEIRNHPTANAAKNRRVNSAVGKGWRLSSRPMAKALGITPEQARELGSMIQREWHQYANGYAFLSDAERKMTFDQQLRLAAHQVMGDGEALGLVEWAEDENTRYKTRLRLVDPDRLSNPDGATNDDVFRAGVEHNAAGVPFRYWIRQHHPADYGSQGLMQWTGWTKWIATNDNHARPQVLHAFEAERAEQTRGISRFVTVLKSLRSLSKFTDATIQNAFVNALHVMFVQSSAGPEAITDNLSPDKLREFNEAREDYYEENPVIAGDDVRATVLKYGDELKMATAQREVDSFDSFTRSIIRMIASSLGVTYEELSMDYSQTNYSSARAALIHSWAETQVLMALLEAQLVKPFFVAWLEEAFDRGYIVAPKGAPSFWDAPDAYANARWIGPGRGVIDPVKEALASAARMEAKTSTAQIENASQGQDWEEIYEEQAIENAYAKELGLQDAADADAQSIQDTKNPAKTAPDPSNDEGQAAPEDQRPAAARLARKGSVLQRLSSAYRAFAEAA